MSDSSLYLPKFVFRGTTYNFEGGRESISKPFRCNTSVNPLVAYYFARVCPGNAKVIYIAEYENLINKGLVTTDSNVLEEIEEDVVWVIKPQDFYKHCKGVVTLDEMRDALNNIGRQPNFSPKTIGDISSACRDKTSRMNVNEIAKLIKIIMPLIK